MAQTNLNGFGSSSMVPIDKRDASLYPDAGVLGSSRMGLGMNKSLYDLNQAKQMAEKMSAWNNSNDQITSKSSLPPGLFSNAMPVAGTAGYSSGNGLSLVMNRSNPSEQPQQIGFASSFPSQDSTLYSNALLFREQDGNKKSLSTHSFIPNNIRSDPDNGMLESNSYLGDLVNYLDEQPAKTPPRTMVSSFAHSGGSVVPSKTAASVDITLEASSLSALSPDAPSFQPAFAIGNTLSMNEKGSRSLHTWADNTPGEAQNSQSDEFYESILMLDNLLGGEQDGLSSVGNQYGKL
jgi:hypothetical protein